MISIKDITIPVLNKPPHFEPKYLPETVNFYLNHFIKPQTVIYLSSMVSNYNEIDFNKLHINKIENQHTRTIIKQDLLNALDDAILEAFYTAPSLEQIKDPSFDEDDNDFIETGPFNDDAKKKLENSLCKQINKLVFQRTANTSTRWGFI